MKNAGLCAKQLTALLRTLPDAAPPDLPGADDPLGVLASSFLLWEATAEKAVAAWRKLREHVVDFNDLRVCMPHETVGYIGARYPLALERSEHLRAALRNVYLREHAMSLQALSGAGKRDVKKYVETLDGMVPYVAARLLLLGFDKHAMPVDEQLRKKLVAEGAADESADVAEVSAWLTRQVKGSAGASVHHRLQRWADGDAKGSKSRTRRRTPSRTPSKQTDGHASGRRVGLQEDRGGLTPPPEGEPRPRKQR